LCKAKLLLPNRVVLLADEWLRCASLVICACYNSPPARWVREWGANDYDAGFVVISWICLAVLACVSRDSSASGSGGAAAAAAKKAAGAPPGAMKKKKK
jgi:hypothetical protein